MADMNANLFTEQLLRDAGIAPGMRVLDVGSGSGDVALLAAKLVGRDGAVVGLDRDAQAVARASERAALEQVSNLSFLQQDLAEALPAIGTFDAVVGRRVLMYLPDATEVIRRIVTSSLRSGGIVAFQESDSTMVPARTSPLPLHDRLNAWMWQTVEREGGNIHMGFALPTVLAQAGLVVDQVRAHAVIQGQGTHFPLATIIRAMLPRIVSHGVATPAEIDIDTLEERLQRERGADVVYVSDMAFCVSAHKP